MKFNFFKKITLISIILIMIAATSVSAFANTYYASVRKWTTSKEYASKTLTNPVTMDSLYNFLDFHCGAGGSPGVGRGNIYDVTNSKCIYVSFQSSYASNVFNYLEEFNPGASGAYVGPGVNGKFVKIVQESLNNLNYIGEDGKSLKEDGLYGDNTKFAIEEFQDDNSLVDDGKVGKTTWYHLTIDGPR
jgi:hypothetical protein